MNEKGFFPTEYKIYNEAKINKTGSPGVRIGRCISGSYLQAEVSVQGLER